MAAAVETCYLCVRPGTIDEALKTGSHAPGGTCVTAVLQYGWQQQAEQQSVPGNTGMRSSAAAAAAHQLHLAQRVGNVAY